MYVVYIRKWNSANALGGVSGVESFIILMNGFNKTEAAVFSCRLCFLKGFPFNQFIKYINIQCDHRQSDSYVPLLNAVCKNNVYGNSEMYMTSKVEQGILRT